MEQQAREIGAEDALKVILAEEVTEDVPTVMEEVIEEKELSQRAVNYKTYGDSLIHPALQQKVTVQENRQHHCQV